MAAGCRPFHPRYIFSAQDWAWLDQAPVSALGDYAGDSVRPVFDTGQAASCPMEMCGGLKYDPALFC